MEDFVANFDTLVSRISTHGYGRYYHGNEIAICLNKIGVRPEEVDRVILTLCTEGEKNQYSITMVPHPTEFTFEQLVEYFGECVTGNGYQTVISLCIYQPTFILKNGDMYHMVNREHCDFELVYPASTLEPFDETKVANILAHDRQPRR